MLLFHLQTVPVPFLSNISPVRTIPLPFINHMFTNTMPNEVLKLYQYYLNQFVETLITYCLFSVPISIIIFVVTLQH